MKNLFLTILIIIPITIFSQEKISYRNAENEIINFQISQDSYFINYNGIIDENKIKSNVKEFIPVFENSALIRIENTNKSFSENIKDLQNRFVNKTISILPVLVYKDGIQQVYDGEIIIKTNNNYPLEDLLKGLKYNVTKNEFVQNLYLIKLQGLNISQSFDLINKFQSSHNIELV